MISVVETISLDRTEINKNTISQNMLTHKLNKITPSIRKIQKLKELYLEILKNILDTATLHPTPSHLLATGCHSCSVCIYPKIIDTG